MWEKLELVGCRIQIYFNSIMKFLFTWVPKARHLDDVVRLPESSEGTQIDYRIIYVHFSSPKETLLLSQNHHGKLQELASEEKKKTSLVRLHCARIKGPLWESPPVVVTVLSSPTLVSEGNVNLSAYNIIEAPCFSFFKIYLFIL